MKIKSQNHRWSRWLMQANTELPDAFYVLQDGVSMLCFELKGMDAKPCYRLCLSDEDITKILAERSRRNEDFGCVLALP